MAKYIYTINGEYRKLKDDVIETFNLSTNDRCGPSHGAKICPGNACSSINGWCGGVRKDVYMVYK